MTETTDLLALLDSDPAAGVLAVADLRERRCDSVTRGEWFAEEMCVRVRALGMEDYDEPWLRTPGVLMPPNRSRIPLGQLRVNVEHAAAEANPHHALAEIALWRQVTEWATQNFKQDGQLFCLTVAAARSYLRSMS